MNDFNREITEFRDEWLGPGDCIVARTSGSTGAPRPVLLPKTFVRESARRSIRHFGLDSSSTLMMSMSPQYIAAKMMIVRACEAQCRLVALPPSSKPALPGNLNNISLLSAVPAQIEGYARALAASGSPSVDHLLLGGSPLTDSQREQSVRLADTVWESYGMTETASHVALRRVTPHTAVPFVTLEGITVSTDSRNCLVIDIPGHGKTVTNDVARIRSEREFEILGRYDNVLICGGIKVHPEAVEAALAPFFSGIGDFYVTSRSHPLWGEQTVVVLETETDPAATAALELEMATYVATRTSLNKAERPRCIIAVPSLKRTDSGKLKRIKMQ